MKRRQAPRLFLKGRSTAARRALLAVFLTIFVPAALRGGPCVRFDKSPVPTSFDLTDLSGVMLDADRDGRTDLAWVVDAGPSDALLLFRDEGIATWSPITVGLLNGPVELGAWDFDRDGDADLAGALIVDGVARWYENSAGDGSSWMPRSVGTLAGILSVEPVDLDRDGDGDLVSTVDSAPIIWFENDGTPASGTWPLHSVATYAAQLATLAADVDTDGDADLVSGSTTGGRVDWLENLGGGASWTLHTIATGLTNLTAFALGDLDPDGQIDVYVASGAPQQIGRYRKVVKDGGWGFDLVSPALDGALHARSLAVLDADGNGGEDVLVELTDNAETIGEADLYFSTAPVSFQEQSLLSAPSPPGGIAVEGPSGFFETGPPSHEIKFGAGYRPSELFEVENPSLVLGLSYTFGTFTATPVGTLDDVLDLGSVDVDGDGLLDVVFGGHGAIRAGWFENPGLDAMDPDSERAPEGSGWALHEIFTATEYFGSVHAADLDGDGDFDLAAASGNLIGRIVWHENLAPGDGSSWTLHVVTTKTPSAWQVDSADIDRDGDLDLVSAALTLSSTQVKIAWIENAAPGDATSWVFHTVTTVGTNPTAVVPVDLDFDGDWDLVTASNSSNSTIYWLENRAPGNGTLWSQHALSTLAGGPNRLAIADVDRDGDSDVAAIYNNDGKLTWLENDGGAGPWSNHVVATALANPWRVVAADFDRDGDPDLLVATANDDSVALYENLGGGSAWTVHVLSTAADFATGLAVADFDGDGDVDPISGARYSGELVWYPNRGRKIFEDGLDADLDAAANLACWSSSVPPPP